MNDRWQIDINGVEFCKLVNKALSKALFQGKDKMPDNKDKMSLVLLELLLYVSEQTKMPKKQKSQFLIQNIQDWKELGNKFTESVKLKFSNEKIVTICADIEDQIMGLDKSERETFMKEIGLNKTGLNQLIREGYDLLNLDTFFTSGPEESRAWTVKKNTLAPKAASVIHTDFEKNFIRAEAVTCEDFIKFGSSEKCKENGKLRIEGKDYVVNDGDVLYFRVNP